MAGGSGSAPLRLVDLRTGAARPLQGPCGEVQQLLPAELCASARRLGLARRVGRARFTDGRLATWHVASGTLLACWPASRCLAQGKALVAGEEQVRVARPGAPPRATRSAAAPPTGGRLRTSEDVYHRMLHDAAYEATQVRIGYEDRFLGPMEVPLLDFKPGSR